jgi:hypothetical protein
MYSTARDLINLLCGFEILNHIKVPNNSYGLVYPSPKLILIIITHYKNKLKKNIKKIKN